MDDKEDKLISFSKEILPKCREIFIVPNRIIFRDNENKLI